MKDIKKLLSRQLIFSYALSIVSDIALGWLFMLTYNGLILEFFELPKINIVGGYVLFYTSKLVFRTNENEIGMGSQLLELHEELFDSFKRKTTRFVHYFGWWCVMKLIVMYH
jgi:hypothetical protein